MELVRLPLHEEQDEWIMNQLILQQKAIHIMMEFMERYVTITNNESTGPIEYNEIIIHQVPGPEPLNPFANFDQMPPWFLSTILLSVIRSTGIDYSIIHELFNQYINILQVGMDIFENYNIDIIIINYKDRNTSRLHRVTLLRD